MSYSFRVVLNEGETILPKAPFLVGCVSHGNIGQMAVDTFIATSFRLGKAKRIGFVSSSYVYPMTGYESYTNGADTFLCQPLEVYAILGSSGVIYAILQRSLCIPSKVKLFTEALLAYLMTVQSSTVVLVTGVSTEGVELGFERNFYHIVNGNNSSHLKEQFLKSFPAINTFINSLKSLHFPVEESMESTQSTAVVSHAVDDRVVLNYASDDIATAPYGMFVAKHFIHAVEQKISMSPLDIEHIKLTDNDMGKDSDSSNSTAVPNVIVFGKFVDEGDNRLDALYITSHLLHGLGVTTDQFKEPLLPQDISVPFSWHVSFGHSGDGYDRSMVY